MIPRRSLRFLHILSISCLAASIVGVAHAADVVVVSTTPARHTSAPPSTAISVVFDRALVPSTVNAGSFRVFGKGSGPASGTLTLSNGNQTATFTPSAPFFRGEKVWVHLSHDIRGTDGMFLRAAGYCFAFETTIVSSGGIQLQFLDEISNLGGDSQTRIYGASATDFNNDGSVDLATVNEVSADIRVTLNRDDGSGLFQPFLPPVPIGIIASPSDVGDFNNDGNADMCVSSTGTDTVWILLGAGNGTFSSVTSRNVGSVPNGITALDVDGDADLDIVNANQVDNNLSLLINNGAGGFAPAVFFDAGVNGEYGIAAGDMNEDGICDLVVCGNFDSGIVTLLGNGNGTFTAAGPVQSCGGPNWVTVLGDMNSDGHLDAASANSFGNSVGVLLGAGNGSFGAVTTLAIGAHTPSVDLGDLDGDGDAELIASCFGGGYWRIFENNGAGGFTFLQDITAPANPSCAGVMDIDNDADLDLVLTDEIADVVVFYENVGNATEVNLISRLDSGLLLRAFPNPAIDQTRLQFFLPQPSAVHVEVLDVSGRAVKSLSFEGLGVGWHDRNLTFEGNSGAKLAGGVYFIRLRAGNAEVTSRIVRLKAPQDR